MGLSVFLALALAPAAFAQTQTLTAASIEGSNPAQLTPEGTGQTPSAAIIKLQVLLDRAGASPGVIDGFDGDNLRKAITAAATMRGDAAADLPTLVGKLASNDPITKPYRVTAKDVAAIVPPIPTDYAAMAERDFLGYTSLAEELAERFHMDEDLLKALNPQASFTEGEELLVTAPGEPVTTKVVRLVADKAARQLRGYGGDGTLVVAYPATIGSEDNPSPTGTHLVDAMAPMPNYTYDPSINFKQGDNTKKLVLPPGPNNPVGSVWIDLTEPTFGIHGTPEPSKIDKVNSHGCVRLTNWDAEELSGLIAKGVPVEFAQ